MIFGGIEKYGDEFAVLGAAAAAHALRLDDSEWDIVNALELGMKQFDTSPLYQNEDKYREMPDDVRIISKFPSSNPDDPIFGYETVIKFFLDSRYVIKNITDYIIHWPMFDKKELKSTWEGFEFLNKEYNINIGVSNFNVEHLKALFDVCTIPPSINQIELNVHLQNTELVQFSKENNLEIQSYCSISQNRKKDVSIHDQIKWLLTLGVNPIIRSSKKERLKELLSVKGVFSDDEMQEMKKFDCGFRLFPDPSLVSPGW